MADPSLTIENAVDRSSGRVACTGILLVGGASARFGSPKALARFRGETLAERGWRVLQHACDEVIAVGKAADGLELSFPVLDDGAEERAPVFGVVAGLRAASTDVCVVLPVDCPLVPAPVLRELAEVGGVPQTGPLPGGYAKTVLPVLEERIAAGELSLRGVNESVLDVDERLLVNVNTPTELVLAEAVALELDDDLHGEASLGAASPEAQELTELATAFWAQALRAARLLRRGEVFRAVDSIDGHLKRQLVVLMAWHAGAVDPSVKPSVVGRSLEHWGDPGALVALEFAYARYSVRDAARALWETIDLFQGLEEETAQRLGLEVELDHADLRRRISEVVPDPKRGFTLGS